MRLHLSDKNKKTNKKKKGKEKPIMCTSLNTLRPVIWLFASNKSSYSGQK